MKRLTAVIVTAVFAGVAQGYYPDRYQMPMTIVGMVSERNELDRPDDRMTFLSDGTTLTFRYDGKSYDGDALRECATRIAPITKKLGEKEELSLLFSAESGRVMRHIAFRPSGTVFDRYKQGDGKWDENWACEGLRVTTNVFCDGAWRLEATMPLVSLAIVSNMIVNVMRESPGRRQNTARSVRAFLKTFGLRVNGVNRPSTEAPTVWENPYEGVMPRLPNRARFENIPSTAEFSVEDVEGAVYHYPGMNRMRVNVVRKSEAERVDGEPPKVLFEGRRLTMTKEGARYTVLTDTPAAPGRYSLSLEVDGKTYADVAAIEKKLAVWEGNDIGKSDIILPRFEPIRAEGNDALSVVHRKYRFDGTGLPRSIVSVGREILADGIRYELVRDGRTRRLSAAAACGLSVSASATKATVEGGAAGEDVEIRSKGRFEYDGFLWNEIELTGKGEIDRLTLVVPLKDVEAPLMHAIVPDYARFTSTGRIPAGEGTVWDGSRLLRRPPTAEDLYAPTVCPYLWFGAELRGLSVFVNDTNGFALDPAKPSARLVREKGVLRLEYDLINAKTSLDGVRRLAFGLEATPVKSPDKALARDYQGPAEGIPTNMVARVPISWDTSGFPLRWARVPKDNNWKLFTDDMARTCPKANMFSFKYSDPTLIWQQDKSARYFASEWISRWGGYDAAERITLVPSCLDYVLYRYKQWTELGLTAIYLDDMHLIACRNRDTAGGSFGILEMRELVKRTAVMQLESGLRHPVLQVHMNTMVPAYAFANSLLSGEDRNPETRYEKRFPVDYVRACVLGTQIGCEGLVLDAIRRHSTPEKDWAPKLKYLTRNQQAILLPCGMRMWVRWEQRLDRDEQLRLIKPLADFAVWEDACAFVPFWEDDGRLGKVPDGVLASSYRRAGRWLVVVGNPTEADQTVELACGASYRNAETNEVIADGRVFVPTGDVRLVYAEGTR